MSEKNKNKNLKESKSALSLSKGIKERSDGFSVEQVDRFLNSINTEMGNKESSFSTELFNKIILGDSVSLSRAITLVESTKKSDKNIANEIIEKSLEYYKKKDKIDKKKSIRIGITGSPGVGKSTFIETFGTYLIEKKKLKIAVLAIDPSSSRNKGSILGDKTRMEELTLSDNAFIRPSPSSGSLGGLGRATRESIILCEAAGYDIVFVETVGVGQSEIMVKSMVDFFLLLDLAGSGDELQGIKKGIMEMADMIVITKADGDNILKCNIAKKERETALHYSSLYDPDWQIPVTTCSSLTGDGVKEIWDSISKYVDIKVKKNKFEIKRENQRIEWFEQELKKELEERFFSNYKVKEKIIILKNEISKGKIIEHNEIKDIIDIFENI